MSLYHWVGLVLFLAPSIELPSSLLLFDLFLPGDVILAPITLPSRERHLVEGTALVMVLPRLFVFLDVVAVLAAVVCFFQFMSFLVRNPALP